MLLHCLDERAGEARTEDKKRAGSGGGDAVRKQPRLPQRQHGQGTKIGAPKPQTTNS